MKYSKYLSERIVTILLFAWLLFSFETFLLTLKGSGWLALFIAVNLTAVFFLTTYLEFRRLKKQYEELRDAAAAIDEKYLMAELMEKTTSMEQTLFKEVLSDMGKSMAEYVNRYKREMKEYKEYIELWIHEVKLPIAAADMIITNHKNEITSEIGVQLKRIEGYTEQALYYARSNDVEKDYLIKDVLLEDVVGEVLAANRKELIAIGTTLSLHDLQYKVKSDSKWLVFIIGQLVNNSMKYAGDKTLHLEAYAEEKKECIRFHLKDNGAGIKQSEQSRVFDKGFTGTNGRSGKKSTGIGLYLCKKLCGRLGNSIEICSEKGNGCEIIITFPKSSFVDVF